MRRFSFALALGAALMAAAPSHAVEIKLIASNAVKEAYLQLLPAYEKASGNTVDVVWGGTAAIIKQVVDGAPADIVLITDFGIDDLVKQGKVAPAGRVIVAKSPVGLAVRAGAKKPDISTPAAFKATMLAAKSVVLTQGPSNPALHTLFETLGIAEAMKPKEVPAIGAGLNDLVIEGKAEMALSQGSELFNVKGLDYAGPLPKGADVVLTYVAAYPVNAAHPAAAKDLVKFLSSPATAPLLKKNGLEPG